MRNGDWRDENRRLCSDTSENLDSEDPTKWWNQTLSLAAESRALREASLVFRDLEANACPASQPGSERDFRLD
jgi:hypothetical protein